MDVETDEIGCPRKIPINANMQTGEIITYVLGIFAIILIILTILYYRYCKKNQYSPSRTVLLNSR